jgi:hypothetical protein
MKKITMTTIGISGSVLVLTAGLLAGCVGSPSSSVLPFATPTMQAKQGTTAKTGMITKTGTTFLLTETGKTPVEIDSYAVTLDQYVGKTVTVTGQYSGDTLFVGSVQ